MKMYWVAASIAAVSLSTVHAAPTADNLTGYLGLGWSQSAGNTDNEDLNAKAGLEYKTISWIHNVDLLAGRTSTNDTVTGERYNAAYKARYQLTDFDYLFGSINYNKDRFSAYDYQLAEVVGYGRRIINEKAQTLDLEIGAGARQAELSTGDSQSDAIIHLGANYHLDINDVTAFDQKLKADIGEDNTYAESVTGLRTKLTGSIAASFTYTVKHNTDVPTGTEKTDRYSVLAVDYSF